MTYSKIMYFSTLEIFNNNVASFPTGLSPICFIGDKEQIWINGIFFSTGDPGVSVTENNGSIIFTIGNISTKISTAGSGLSIKKGSDGGIIITSSALTTINTSTPLSYNQDTNTLTHNESGANAGSYGQTASITGSNVITVPYITIDVYGHITSVTSNKVTIRDYVDQQPDVTSGVRNILVGYTPNNNDETNPVLKGNGLTYDNSTGAMTTKGGITMGGSSKVNGDLNVEGIIYGTLNGDVTGSATPKIHLSSKPEYGGASTNLYGHVKLQDSIPTTDPGDSSDNTDTNSATVTNGVAASPKMIFNTIQQINTTLTSSGDFTVGTNGLILKWEEISN